MRHFTRYVFSTYTYDRSLSADKIGSTLGVDFNRYIQRFRRLHPFSIHYLRSVELHQDGYPHIHSILYFEQPITIQNLRYFDNDLYAKWKSVWTRGLSDYQPPYRSERNPILYIIKYILKSGHTHKTIWKKILADTTTLDTKKITSPLPDHPSSKDVSFADQRLIDYLKLHKIKQVTWSRGFIFPKMTMLTPPPAGQKTLN